MRLGWRIGLPGPFYLGGTVWRSKRRPRPQSQAYFATLPDGWRCHHRHRRPDTAAECSRREARKRGLA